MVASIVPQAAEPNHATDQARRAVGAVLGGFEVREDYQADQPEGIADDLGPEDEFGESLHGVASEKKWNAAGHRQLLTPPEMRDRVP